ncbi:MFS transporter [Kitasatospora sp. NBC_01250]|uniref:MFS transporter n=1 Tax=Kitasatospora sp. NBC_01250 TaxID=2903571 RepID=UPI002E3458FD|nr:MFS transporter [Kitasatospora sp. NBC_01250]
MTGPLPVADPPPARTAVTPEGLFSRTYAAVTVSFTAVMFLTGFAALAVLPTLPVAARDLHGVGRYPLVAGCFVAASLLGGVLGGSWADRAGARRPLAAGTALAVVTLLVSATSTTIWQLAAGRFLDGLAAGMVAVSVNTAIGQAYPDRLRPRVLSLMSTSWIIPSLAGPPVAGLVAAWWSWRVVFFGLAALTALPALAVIVLLRRTATPAPAPVRTSAGERPPRPGLLVALAVSVGAALGQWAVAGWDAAHLLCLLLALGLLVAFTPRLLPPGTWRAARGLPVTVLLRGLGSGSYFTLEAFVPLLLDTARRVPTAVTGLAFTGAAVAWAASSWVQSHLLADRPRQQLVAVGALVLALAAGLGIAGTLPALPALTAAAAIVVAALGMGLLAPSVTLLSLSHSPPDRQGYASSAMQTAQNLGQVGVLGIASAVFNACSGSHGAGLAGYGTVFALLLVPSLLAALLAGRTRTA